MKRLALAVALLLGGCFHNRPPVKSPVTPEIVVPVKLVSHVDTFSNRVLVERAAWEFFGIRAVFVDNEVGVIRIDVVNTKDYVGGRAYDTWGCIRLVRTRPRLDIIAHELLHALGHRFHVKDKGNLMNPSAGKNTTTTQKQRNMAARHARRLMVCNPKL